MAWARTAIFLADAAEPEDADGLAVELGEQRETGGGRPLALAHELVGLRNAAGQRDHQPDGDFGHRVVEYVGGVGDADIAGPGGLGVDRVVADAEIGDDLELREPVHQGRVDIAAGDGADTRRDGGDQRVPVGGLVQLVDGEALGQRLLAAASSLWVWRISIVILRCPL